MRRTQKRVQLFFNRFKNKCLWRHVKLPKAHSRTGIHSHQRTYEYTHTHTHNYSKSVSGLRFPDLFHSFTFSPPTRTRTCSPSHYFSFCLLFWGLFRPARNHLNSRKKRLKPDGASGRRKYLRHCERENWNAMPRQISGIRFSFGFSLGRFGTFRGFSIEYALRCLAYPREGPTRAPSLSMCRETVGGCINFLGYQ